MINNKALMVKTLSALCLLAVSLGFVFKQPAKPAAAKPNMIFTNEGSRNILEALGKDQHVYPCNEQDSNLPNPTRRI